MGGSCPSHIPLTEIKTYANMFGPHDADDLHRFVMLITAMDTEYVNHHVAELNKQAKK